MSGSLNLVWSLINSLQVITHIPMLNVNYPANTLAFHRVIVGVINFDIIPAEEMSEAIFDFSKPWENEDEQEAETE